MKAGTFLAIAGFAWTVTTGTVGAVLVYVVKIEHRLTKLETRDEQRQVVRPRAGPKDLKA